MDENRQIFTLTELGKSIRSVIERNYTTSYWIQAEIAKLNFYPRSGHCYPELVHKTSNVVQAQMRATIWAADYKRINKQFSDITGELLREGLTILFRASVTFHPVYGLSLQIWEIEPSFTLGEMAVEKARVIAKLKKQNIFDNNKELKLAILPKRIAVISVETSKGYHDFMNILNAYASKYAVWHFLFPSVLQGDKAVEGIISQLRIIKKAVARFDLVAIIRGGGGDIGLSCYDEYALAKEIALFPLPVITGIGHSTNETISEMVAWGNKITPTDVGYFILEKFRHYEQRVDDAANSLITLSSRLLEASRQHLNYREESLHGVVSSRMQEDKKLLLQCANSLALNASGLCVRQRKNLDNLAFFLSINPVKSILSRHFNLESQSDRLAHAVKQRFTIESNKTEYLQDKVQILDPSHVLNRGYSITTFNGNPVRKASELNEGDVIHTKFQKGEAVSIVREKRTIS